MTQDIHRDRLLILDFGSQYTQLIARRIREVGVYCEIMPWDTDASDISAFVPSGIILSGGPESVTETDSPRAPDIVFALDVPLLGICYGMQTMAAQLGGVVEGSDTSEFGYAQIRRTSPGGLFADFSDETDSSGRQLLDVWMSHGDKVSQLPPDFERIAETDSCPIAGMAHIDKPWFGIQFHPEVTHTAQGENIFTYFVQQICACETLWTPANIVEDAIRRVQAQVGNDRVLLGLSGGVDSSVVAALLHRAIGDQLTCVFVDNGLLRLNEGDQVMAMFAQNMGVRVIRANAEARFLDKLQGVSDPEAKRKAIGNTFIDVFDEEATKITDVKWLAQGTIYPDVIESAGSKTGKAHVIKSHHSVGGLPDDMALELVEPLRELFKDEVRRIGL
ncbi:MAG: glutamine-hydrolyzing GMP synthase, partial [Halieaceae bacterium]|nr:glutamine-hydrolyzing GMP synthase [Halieaceae bacterium]